MLSEFLEAIYRRPTLRRMYWLARSPFSPFASYRWATECLAASLFSERRVGAGYQVATGPFAGLIHTRSGSGVNLPCLLGVYEHEIHGWIDEVIQAHYSIVIDIGCAEGYYANGLALKAGCKVVACDISPRARWNCLEMARLNKVNNLVTVRDGLTHESLESLLDGHERPFVLSDIEGAETELLDPLRVPSLRRTDMIVEIHGTTTKDSLSSLEQRFMTTHTVRVAEFSPIGLGWLTTELRAYLASFQVRHAESLILALAEPRGYSRWAFFKARA